VASRAVSRASMASRIDIGGFRDRYSQVAHEICCAFWLYIKGPSDKCKGIEVRITFSNGGMFLLHELCDRKPVRIFFRLNIDNFPVLVVRHDPHRSCLIHVNNEAPMTTTLEMVAEIVAAHASTTNLSKEELLAELSSVYQALAALEQGEVMTAAAPAEAMVIGLPSSR